MAKIDQMTYEAALNLDVSNLSHEEALSRALRLEGHNPIAILTRMVLWQIAVEMKVEANHDR